MLELGLLDIGVCTAAIVTVFALFMKSKPRHKYPPSPKGLPFVGNIFDVPSTRQWVAFAEWSRKLESSIISFDMMGSTFIILNDLETVTDLLEKRGALYNGRPRMPMLTEACAFDWNFGFTRDMELWKFSRTAFDQRFRRTAALKYREHEISMTYVLLQNLLDSPDHWREHFEYMTASLILDIAYGIQTKPEGDEFVQIAKRGIDAVNKAGEPNIIDIFPWARHVPIWFPGMQWKKEVDELRRWSLESLNKPAEWVKARLADNTAKQCFMTDLLEKHENVKGISPSRLEYFIKGTVGTTMIAGAETSATSLEIMILAMVLYPDVQKRAQAEIDRVVGSSRLPDFGDEDSLPYLTAITKEILRWSALVPFAIPHTATAPDVYRGYYIPKGAVVLPNTWAILHDPTVYPDPETFNPSRYLTADGMGLDTNAPMPEAVFGYGRRTCPGRFMAMATLWISSARFIATFNVNQAIGVDGNAIPLPDELFSKGPVVHPNAFECSITPRSNKAAELIRVNTDE